MRSLIILCLLLASSFAGLAQTVSITTDTAKTTQPAFIGVSTEFMYSIMRGEANEQSTAYDTAYVDAGVLEALKPLQLHHLRFPGGTVSQYYHFRGGGGYGTIPEDLECREGFIHLPNMIQKVSTDDYYPENMIGPYRTMAESARTGSPAQTLYVLNLMGHFFHGDLLPFNTLLDTLIASYGAPLGGYLEASPRFLDTSQVNMAIEILHEIFQDDAIAGIQAALLQDPGFQFRLGDNLDAIAYLDARQMPITGIELGNENFAYTMLKDDDLSEFPYDCTTPDSIVNAIGSVPIKTRAYMQAMLRYALVTEMYATAIHLNTDIPVGGVLTPNEFRVEFLGIDSFTILPSPSERARYYEIWNGFIGNLDFYDALMPHFYMNSIPECPTFDGLSADSIALFGEHYLDFYFTDILPNQLQTIRRQVNDKPIWITEWNINTANLFGNTFFHASHCFRFMNFMNAMQDTYGIELINYHNLSAWNYNQFALLRTEDVDSVFTVKRQAMFYPFMLMGALHAREHYVSPIDMSAWVGEAASSGPEHYYQAYTSVANDSLILHFINLSDEPVELDLESVEFAHNHNTAGGGLKIATGGHMQLLNAGSIFSSDRGCDDYPQYFDSYTWETQSFQRETIELPPYALGALHLGLDRVVGGNEITWRDQVSLHPNPASEIIEITIPLNMQELVHSVRVQDITGKTLDKLPYRAAGMAVGHIPPGYYLITLADASGTPLHTEKLIISRR